MPIADSSPPSEFASRQALCSLTAQELQRHRQTPSLLRLALSRYFRRGLDLGLSTGELVDLLGVSTPSILTLASFTEAEQDFAMRIVEQLSDDEIADAPGP